MLRQKSMHQLFKILLLLICFMLIYEPSYSALKCELEYKIPIDYTKLSTEELENKAGFYYNLSFKSSNGNVNEDVTSALNLYTILSNKSPDVQIYKIRLGNLYDYIGKSRFARRYYEEALGVDSTRPEIYYRLGEFYYKRDLYKKALKNYKEAYKKGYSTHYETLYKLGDIYEKFGDTEAALRYLKLASEQSPNSRLDNKITKLENFHLTNKEYYSNTRIRIQER